MACLTYSQLLSAEFICQVCGPVLRRWQKSNLINQRDAVAPNDADDYEMMKMLVEVIMLIISVMTMMLLAQMSNPIYDQPTRLSEMCTKGKTL